MNRFLYRKLKARRDRLRADSYARGNDSVFKRDWRGKIIFGFMFLVFALFALSFIYPFVWVFLNSFKTNREFTSNFGGWPSMWTGENYAEAWNYRNSATRNFSLFQMLGMSLLVAGLGTLATVLTSSACAYVIAKYRFPGRNLIWGVVIFAMIVPIVGALPSQIQLMRAMGLDGTVLGVVFLYSGGFGANFLLLYSFFKNLSWTYVEAAYMDGANDFTIFFRIIVPMAKGPIIAVSVIQLIGLWNDYLTPSIYLSEQPTIAVGLYYLSTNLMDKGLYTVLFASIVLTMLPIIAVFCLFSKTIMENTAVGGLKG